MRRLLPFAVIAITLALALAGCGKRDALVPLHGAALPVRPATAVVQPSVDDLLAVPTQARPDRVDDPLTRSVERPDDRFHLPPPG